MKIIYNCYGGSHSSVTSAAIHLGLLQCDRVPCKKDLWKLPYYDTQVKKDHGTLHFMGKDEFGHEVFVVGRRNMGKPVQRVIRDIAKIFAIPEQEYMLVDPMPYVNLAMKIGGITSRRLGLVFPGRPLVTWGNRLAFPRLSNMVKRVKENLPAAHPFSLKLAGVRAVIYCDYTGRQQSALAARFHLQHDHKPTSLPRLPVGQITSWGEDQNGVKVFSLGVSYENELLPKIMREFANLFGVPEQDLTIVDLVGKGKVKYVLAEVTDRLPLLRGLGSLLEKKQMAAVQQIVDNVKQTLNTSPPKV